MAASGPPWEGSPLVLIQTLSQHASLKNYAEQSEVWLALCVLAMEAQVWDNYSAQLQDKSFSLGSSTLWPSQMLINGYERRKQGKLLYAKFVHWHLFVLCFAVVCEASSSLKLFSCSFFHVKCWFVVVTKSDDYFRLVKFTSVQTGRTLVNLSFNKCFSGSWYFTSMRIVFYF